MYNPRSHSYRRVILVSRPESTRAKKRDESASPKALSHKKQDLEHLPLVPGRQLQVARRSSSELVRALAIVTTIRSRSASYEPRIGTPKSTSPCHNPLSLPAGRLNGMPRRTVTCSSIRSTIDLNGKNLPDPPLLLRPGALPPRHRLNLRHRELL